MTRNKCYGGCGRRAGRRYASGCNQFKCIKDRYPVQTRGPVVDNRSPSQIRHTQQWLQEQRQQLLGLERLADSTSGE
jgi:hypothetical protein